MRKSSRIPLFIACLLYLLLLCKLDAPAADTVFVAALDGQHTVPPRAGVTASGMATMVLNDTQDQLSFDILISGLSTPEFASHFHNAPPGERGLVQFTLPNGVHKVGTWDIPPDMVTELFNGRLYINVHTERYREGEIRGDVTEPVPVRPSTWGSIKSLYEIEF